MEQPQVQPAWVCTRWSGLPIRMNTALLFNEACSELFKFDNSTVTKEPGGSVKTIRTLISLAEIEFSWMSSLEVATQPWPF